MRSPASTLTATCRSRYPTEFDPAPSWRPACPGAAERPPDRCACLRPPGGLPEEQIGADRSAKHTDNDGRRRGFAREVWPQGATEHLTPGDMYREQYGCIGQQ